MNPAALRASRELSAGLIARLQQRLTQSIGLEATLFGIDAVGYAVRSRMTALGLTAAIGAPAADSAGPMMHSGGAHTGHPMSAAAASAHATVAGPAARRGLRASLM